LIFPRARCLLLAEGRPFYSAVRDLYLDFQNGDVNKMSNAYADICGTKDIPYLNLFDELASNDNFLSGLESEDGLHSNADGYQAVTDLIDNWATWKANSV
jgi:lysophospholipase L1-like esterase